MDWEIEKKKLNEQLNEKLNEKFDERLIRLINVKLESKISDLKMFQTSLNKVK